MISYPDALALLVAEARRLESEPVHIEAADGRVLAADIVSPLSLPGFDNAAMDGYAVRASDGVIPAGTTYDVAAMHAAGDATLAYPGAEACEIATGARLPDGFDTVIPVERSERSGERVRLLADETAGQNVRITGDDIRAGAVALRAGRRVDAPAVMLLAALGVDSVPVARRPRVAVIATGTELNATGPLPAGGIHDSNGPFLATALRRWGADVLFRTRVADTGDAFHAAVRDARAAGADLIVTTGAVSAGRYDFVPAALHALGARELFHKVAIRPGKPLLAAQFDDGPLVVALPGNPIAVAVGYRFFVAPVLRVMAGLATERPVTVTLDGPHRARPGLLHFGLGTQEVDGDGRQVAQLSSMPSAFRIVPFTEARVWLTTDGTGDMAGAWPLDPADAA